MKLTTTFNKLKLAGACGQQSGSGKGYDLLANFLGGTAVYGKDTEINLLTILESNGLDDALWCLRATIQDVDKINRLIACDFAESVLHIYESKYPNDFRPRLAIQAARDYVENKITLEEMRKARAAADAADARKTKKAQLAQILIKHLQD